LVNGSPSLHVLRQKGKTSVLPSKNCFAILVGYPLHYEHFPIQTKGQNQRFALQELLSTELLSKKEKRGITQK